MKTLIFLSQRGYQYYDFSPYADESEYRLIVILEKRFYQLFPEDKKKYFSKIHILENQSATKTVLLPLDYNTVEKIVADELKRIEGQAHNLRIICTDEFNMLLAGKLRDRYEIPGASFAACMVYRDKVLMKTVLIENHIRVPKFMLLDYKMALEDTKQAYKNVTENIANSFIIKPVSGAGSVGTSYIKEYEAFHKFLVEYKNEPVDFEVEEHISGDMYHCDSIIVDGKIVSTFHSRYNRTCLDFNFGHVMGSIVLQNEDPLIPRLNTMVNNALNALGLINGVTHMELFHSDADEIVFLEVAARTPGALIVPMYQTTYNVNFYDIYLAIEAKTFTDLKRASPNPYSFGVYFPNIPGEVLSLNEPNIKSQYTIKWAVKPGTVIEKHAQSLLDSTGSLLVTHENYQTLLHDFNSMLNYKPITIKS